MHIRMIAPKQIQTKEIMRINRTRDITENTELVSYTAISAYIVTIMVRLYYLNLFLANTLISLG
jgi:hypothetical protein